MRPSKRWRGSTRWSSTEMTVNAISAADGSGRRPVVTACPTRTARGTARTGGPPRRRHGRPARPGGSCGPSGRRRTRPPRGRRPPGRGTPCPGRRPAAPRRRRPAARCRRPGACIQEALSHAAAGGDDAPCVRPAEVDDVAHRERRTLGGGPPHGRGTHADVEVVQRGPTVGIVERHPLATQVGLPDRDRVEVELGAGRVELIGVDVAEQPPDPVDEEAAGVRRAADQRLARRGVGHGPDAVDLHPLRRDRPHDGGGAEDDEHVAVVDRPGHELLAERVDGARPDHRAGGRPAGRDCADRPAPRHQRRKAGGVVEARVLRHARVPPGEVEQRQRRHGDDRVDRTDPGRARGWRPPGPASTRPRRGGPATSQARKRASSPDCDGSAA